ncbi:MAG: hypothetical protein Hyperionvirus40_6 [Hyperionvirus sp.]|uniref:Uncharacterized protein n=1 Tax=Hyperionvirus sp. TaxID=2487770 RepID=A0A3G5ACC4_9VIRU|nr:MAG: hypothetical protein Hyperionvirus40_6 [Hyperionvirus sp.]
MPNSIVAKSLTVTMTNDTRDNKIKVYNTETHSLLQSMRTGGKGGVAGNAFGIKQFKNKLLAVVNYGSGTVSVFKRKGDKLFFYKKVSTSSSPVSIDFGFNHMYVAGVTTVDSFSLECFERDGTVQLVLEQGGGPGVGSTSQVGVVKKELLVTLKNDPNPGTVDVITLRDDGSVSGKVTPVLAPPGTRAPFGFNVFKDGTALITLAHTNNLGLFRDNDFVDSIKLDQNAPCWATALGKYAFIINAGSQTISRVVSTGENIFIDAEVAASISSGNPADADQKGGNLVVVDHDTTTSHLNFFRVNEFGQLFSQGELPVDVNVPNANGVAIMSR